MVMEIDAVEDGSSGPRESSSPNLTPPGRPFYDPRSNVRPFVARLNDPGNSDKQAATLSVWQLIAQSCFPDTEPQHDNEHGAAWAVGYDSIPEAVGKFENDPMYRAQKLVRVRLHLPQNIKPTNQHHNIMTIECDSPSENSPAGWKDLIETSTARMAHSHSMETNALIIAIGASFLPFRWERERNPSIGPFEVTVSIESDTLTFPSDDRLQPVRITKYFPGRTEDIQESGSESGSWKIDLKKIPSILDKGDSMALERFLLQVRKEALIEHGVPAPTKPDTVESKEQT